VPFTLGESVSSNDIPLVERAAIVNVATNIFANDFRSALGVRSYTERYWAGLYLTGPQSGATHNHRGTDRHLRARQLTSVCRARSTGSTSS